MLLQQNNFLTWSRSQLFHCLYFTHADSVQFFGQAQCRFCTERFITKKQGSKPPSSYSCSRSQFRLPLKCISNVFWVDSLYIAEHSQSESRYLLHECVWKYSDVHIQKICSREGMYGRCLRRHLCVVCSKYNMFSFTQRLLHAQGNITKRN